MAKKIAIIDIEGQIKQSEEIIKLIENYGSMNSVKAIIPRINSEGGTVAATQEIYEALSEVDKYVITSIGNMAASGAYYISLASDKIVANAGSVIGSIGVIMEVNKFHELSEKIGIGKEVVKSGEMKDFTSWHRPMKSSEKLSLQSLTDDARSQFIDVIYKNRSEWLNMDEIDNIADGSIYTGRQAYDLNLIDYTGTLNSAISIACGLAGIKEGSHKIIRKKKKKKFLSLDLFKSMISISDIGISNLNKASFEYRLKL